MYVNEYLEAFDFVMNAVMLPRQYGKSATFTACMIKVIEGCNKAKQYEKIIQLIETANMDIDSVLNLLYIHANEIDKCDENREELINKLFKEGNIKGYDK